FRWKQDSSPSGGTMSALDTLLASGVSADGAVVVGEINYGTPHPEAAIWTESQGVQSIHALLTNAGIDLAGWTLQSANGISADGTVVVGAGVDPDGHTRAWIAKLPESQDTTPPVLTVPATVTVDATSPSGAAVPPSAPAATHPRA